ARGGCVPGAPLRPETAPFPGTSRGNLAENFLRVALRNLLSNRRGSGPIPAGLVNAAAIEARHSQRNSETVTQSRTTIAPAARAGKAVADLTVVGGAGHVGIPL